MHRIFHRLSTVLLCIGCFSLDAAVFDLADLQGAVLYGSSDIRMLKIEEEKSRIDAAAARSSLHPHISLQASGTYLANPMDAVQFPLALPGMPPEIITVMDAQEPFWYQLGIRVRQNLFTWGKITRSIKLHRLLVDAASLRRSIKEQELETRTAVLVYSLKHLERMIEAAEGQQELAIRLTDIIRESFHAGFVVEEEVITVELQAVEIEIAVLELYRSRNMILQELRELTGIELKVGEIRFPPNPEHRVPDLEQLRALALSVDREPLEIMRVIEQVQELSEKISRGSMYWKPDIGLQVEAGYQGAEFPFIESGWNAKSSYSLNVTIALEMTLWDGGSRIQDVRKKQQELEAAQVSTVSIRNDITRELTDTCLKYKVLLSRMEYNRLKELSFASRTASARRQYDAGAGSEADLLKLQLESLGHALRSEQDALDAAAAYLTIELLTGGRWKEE